MRGNPTLPPLVVRSAPARVSNHELAWLELAAILRDAASRLLRMRDGGVLEQRKKPK
jgi:hypothetical protein